MIVLALGAGASGQPVPGVAPASGGALAERPGVRPERPPTVEQARPAIHGLEAQGAAVTAPLHPEGTFLTARRGRMARVSGEWVFFFDADAAGVAEAPMPMLPGVRLTEMESLASSRRGARTFNVSGEVFVYHGRNYLLPTFFTLVAPAEEEASLGAEAARAAEGAPADVSAMAERLESARGPSRIVPPRAQPTEQPTGRRLRREGEFVNARRARLEREPGGRWRAVFDGDAAAGAEEAATADAPMRLLPSQTLERLEALAARGGDRIPVSISGQVFVYGGENYLLPTMFTINFADAGDLRPAQ